MTDSPPTPQWGEYPLHQPALSSSETKAPPLEGLGRLSFFIILLVLLIDQGSKIWIKTHMFLGQEYRVLGDWFLIHFTENYGMAFGLEFGGSFGKLILSVFRIVLVSGIAWYLYRLIRTSAHRGAIVCFSLIFAGAVGNIIDSAFYGMLFSDSNDGIARMFPPEGGYAAFLHGRVVDMLYFPLISGQFPEWFPFWGGESFLFFRPVFNIADSSITIGVATLLLFQKKYFPHDEEKPREVAPEAEYKEEEKHGEPLS